MHFSFWGKPIRRTGDDCFGPAAAATMAASASASGSASASLVAPPPSSALGEPSSKRRKGNTSKIVTTPKVKPLDKKKPVGRLVLVPVSAVTEEALAESPCQEHGGKGWSAQITRVSHDTATVRWIAKEPSLWARTTQHYDVAAVLKWSPLK